MVGGPRAPAALMYVISVVGIEENPSALETTAQQLDLLVTDRPGRSLRHLFAECWSRGWWAGTPAEASGLAPASVWLPGLSGTIGKVEQTRRAR